jgi:trehalose 6-phosphate phosphatase
LQPVPSSDVEGLLAPFWADPGAAAVFTDFDGTLAAIVDDPATARPLPDVGEVLGGLASRFGRVGVISGRPAAFLLEHLGGHGLFLSGLYGLEEASDDAGVQATPEADRWRTVVEEAACRAEEELGGGRVSVERKGLSVAVHFRTDPSADDRARSWAEGEADRTGLALHPARMSYELRPPVPRDKGSVLADAAAGAAAACFMGDDRGDLTAFDTLDRMAEGGAAALRVGVTNDEAPPELLERADLVVEGPEGALRLLRRLRDG